MKTGLAHEKKRRISKQKLHHIDLKQIVSDSWVRLQQHEDGINKEKKGLCLQVHLVIR